MNKSMYLGVLEARSPSKFAPCVSQGVPKRTLWHPMGVPNEHFGHPRGSKTDPWSPKGGPKSIGMALGTPLEHRSIPGWFRDVERRSKDQPFWTFLGAPGRSKVPFWIQGGFQKGFKIDMGRQGRHLWGPRWAKRLFKRGFQNGVGIVIEKGSRNESFWDG